MSASRLTIKDSPTVSVPVYEVRLVQARRPLRLSEACVSDGNMAARVLHAMIGTADREHFVALFLNGTHTITGAHVVAVGGQQSLGIEARTVFRAAIAACAVSVVLGHNHPSGDPTPSVDDFKTTSSLMAAGCLLGVPVLDHVIVTGSKLHWHSMMAEGTLPKVSS